MPEVSGHKEPLIIAQYSVSYLYFYRKLTQLKSCFGAKPCAMHESSISIMKKLK